MKKEFKKNKNEHYKIPIAQLIRSISKVIQQYIVKGFKICIFFDPASKSLRKFTVKMFEFFNLRFGCIQLRSRWHVINYKF